MRSVAQGMVDPHLSSAGLPPLIPALWAPHWTPPKGRLDPGENAMEAALRETKEESGLEPATMLTVYEDISTQIRYVRKIRPKAFVVRNSTIRPTIKYQQDKVF